MSLIADALKTAQRAKQARESTPRAAPVLVPLRSRPKATVAWTRWVLLIVGGAGVLTVAWLAFQRVQRETLRPLQAPAPILLGDAPAVAAVAPVRRPAVDSHVVTPAPTKTVAAAPHRPSPAPARPRAAESPFASSRTEFAATPQGQADVGARRTAEAAAGTGLRIAVDQPRDPDAVDLFAMAVAAHRAGDVATARSLYERVLVKAPDDVDALNNLGVLLSSLRELDRADQLLRRAVAFSPRNASVWSNLGTVLRERGQSSDAIAAFQHALDIDPTHRGARISLAQQFLAIAAYPQAREILDEIVAANPEIPEAQYALGQVLERQGDIPGAMRAYSAFVRVAPPRLAADAERVRRRVEVLASRKP